jgi:hypothetical protein
MSIAKSCSRSSFETQVSNFDRLTAGLLASIIVVGAVLLILATLLIREKSIGRPLPPRPVPPTTPILGEINSDDLVDPGTEAPELESEIINLSQFETDVLSAARARSALFFQGSNDSPGDGDQRGIGPPDVDPVPPHPLGAELQRWKINYELSDIETYSAQLRFFGIELGLVSKNTNDLWRIADIGQKSRVSTSSREQEQNSVYFVSTNARMARWDKRLASESLVGSPRVDLDNVILVHFYPASTVELLKTVELAAIPSDKTIEQVTETNFRLVPIDGGFEFEVTGIKFE